MTIDNYLFTGLYSWLCSENKESKVGMIVAGAIVGAGVAKLIANHFHNRWTAAHNALPQLSMDYFSFRRRVEFDATPEDQAIDRAYWQGRGRIDYLKNYSNFATAIAVSGVCIAAAVVYATVSRDSSGFVFCKNPV